MQTAAVMGAFLLLGFGARPATPYNPPAMSRQDTMSQQDDDAQPAGETVWLVDGFNVLHAGLPNGEDRGEWWRAEAREQLVERAAGFDEAGAEVWVVFDGRRPAPEAEGARPRVHFAPSADTWLLERVRAAEDPDQVVVVTRDRRLADRAKRRGARVVGPTEFLSRCPAV